MKAAAIKKQYQENNKKDSKKARKSSFFGCCTADISSKRDINLSDVKTNIDRPTMKEHYDI